MTGESAARRLVRQRSGGQCEARLPNCAGRAREWDHRINRSQGGRWSPANGLDLCPACHRWKTEHPALAGAKGLRLVRGSDPARWPAYVWTASLGRAWVHLRGDGTVQLCRVQWEPDDPLTVPCPCAD